MSSYLDDDEEDEADDEEYNHVQGCRSCCCCCFCCSVREQEDEEDRALLVIQTGVPLGESHDNCCEVYYWPPLGMKEVMTKDYAMALKQGPIVDAGMHDHKSRAPTSPSPITQTVAGFHVFDASVWLWELLESYQFKVDKVLQQFSKDFARLTYFINEEKASNIDGVIDALNKAALVVERYPTFKGAASSKSVVGQGQGSGKGLGQGTSWFAATDNTAGPSKKASKDDLLLRYRPCCLGRDMIILLLSTQASFAHMFQLASTLFASPPCVVEVEDNEENRRCWDHHIVHIPGKSSPRVTLMTSASFSSQEEDDDAKKRTMTMSMSSEFAIKAISRTSDEVKTVAVIEMTTYFSFASAYAVVSWKKQPASSTS